MNDYENCIIRKLVSFGKGNDLVRAMLQTGSLCSPDAPVDILSDFDVEMFFEDPTSFVENDDWIDTLGFGKKMSIWHWPNEWDEEEGDGRRGMRMVYFQDGTKMDIFLRYLDDLRNISSADTLPDHYDVGYRVILDKDGVTSAMRPPTYRAYILSAPTAAQYASRIEAFWMNSTYVAKYLWRNEVIAAKWRLHELADRGLREMLEWSVAMEHDWTWKPGKLGCGLIKAIDADTATELLRSYAAGDITDLWESLFRTTALYRKTAIRVGEKLGYEYPHDLDNRVSIFHRTIRSLDREVMDRDALAEALGEACTHTLFG